MKCTKAMRKYNGIVQYWDYDTNPWISPFNPDLGLHGFDDYAEWCAIREQLWAVREGLAD